MTRALETLADALEWLALHWAEREVPLRLHSRDTGDDGAPAFHPAFARHLNARPDDTAQVTTTRTCSHLRLAKSNPTWECPDCAGSGAFETTLLAYRYPMWRAMDQLARANRVAHDVVLTLVINGYDTAGTMGVLGIREKGLLAAIRALYGRYQRAPSGGRIVGWVSKSDSQRAAEEGGRMAAMVPA